MDWAAARDDSVLGGGWRHLWPAVNSLVAVTGLFLFGWFIVSVDEAGPSHRRFSDLFEYRVWAASTSVSLLLWIFAFVSTMRIPVAGFRAHAGDQPRRWLPPLAVAAIALYALLAVVLALGPGRFALLQTDMPLPTSLEWRRRLLAGASLLAAAPAVVGIWSIAARLQNQKSALEGRSSPWPAASFLEELRRTGSDSQRCLTAVTIVMVTGVMNTVAFRPALVEAGYRPAASSALTFGAFFTTLILIIYVPLFLARRRRVLDFMDLVYPLPQDVRLSEEWIAGRVRLLKFLGADLSVTRYLTAAVSILSPLVTSLLSTLIPE